MLHGIVATFLKQGGPYLYLRLVTAAYAVCAIGRVIPVKRKQVPGYRWRKSVAARPRGSARHRARPSPGAYPPSPQAGAGRPLIRR